MPGTGIFICAPNLSTSPNQKATAVSVTLSAYVLPTARFHPSTPWHQTERIGHKIKSKSSLFQIPKDQKKNVYTFFFAIFRDKGEKNAKTGVKRLRGFSDYFGNRVRRKGRGHIRRRLAHIKMFGTWPGIAPVIRNHTSRVLGFQVEKFGVVALPGNGHSTCQITRAI